MNNHRDVPSSIVRLIVFWLYDKHSTNSVFLALQIDSVFIQRWTTTELSLRRSSSSFLPVPRLTIVVISHSVHRRVDRFYEEQSLSCLFVDRRIDRLSTQRSLYSRSSNWFCLRATISYRRSLFTTVHRYRSLRWSILHSSVKNTGIFNSSVVAMGISQFLDEQSSNSLFIHHGNDPFSNSSSRITNDSLYPSSRLPFLNWSFENNGFFSSSIIMVNLSQFVVRELQLFLFIHLQDAPYSQSIDRELMFFRLTVVEAVLSSLLDEQSTNFLFIHRCYELVWNCDENHPGLW